MSSVSAACSQRRQTGVSHAFCAGWDWKAVDAEILGLGGFAFAVLSNAVFLIASVRYARAIHPRLHLGGFLLGIAASLVLLLLYAHILPWMTH
jgi:hypothetical protein